MNSAIYVHNLSLVGSRTDEFDELINDKFITHFLGFMNFHICIQSMSKYSKLLYPVHVKIK